VGDVKNEKRSTIGRLKSSFSKEALLLRMFDDLINSGLPLSANDASTMSRRYANEGSRFLFVTLKEISSLLLLTLEFGVFPAQHSFAALPGSRVPRFLGGLWSHIIDETGSLRFGIESDPMAVRCIKALLQIGSSFSKYEESFPKEMIPKFLEEFVATDRALHDVQLLDEGLLSQAANIITEVFRNFSLQDIRPKHGPGAVSTGERDEEKWEFSQLIKTLHNAYPYYEWFIGGGTKELLDRVTWYRNLERVDHGTAKVIVVPKTSTSLRTISMEPLAIQFVQQGQMARIVSLLQRHRLTRGHINFDDQSTNRILALVNSKTKQYATLDLSAASDRLSLKLVKSLFRNLEDNVLRFLLASRSTHTKLPDGSLLEMQKFAPMGSATCFPVQSICFFALCVSAISIALNAPVSEVSRHVFVYGDDIIVESVHMNIVAEALESVGLKVNRDKSFSRGHFRESCGIFAFAGQDITPIRFKTTFPQSNVDGRGIAAWIAYAHACEESCLFQVAEYIYSTIEELTGKLPYGFSSSSYFCRLASNPYDLMFMLAHGHHDIRWNSAIQRIEIRALGLSTRNRVVELDGWQRLFRDLLTSYSDSDPNHAVVARSAKAKPAWHAVL